MGQFRVFAEKRKNFWVINERPRRKQRGIARYHRHSCENLSFIHKYDDNKLRVNFFNFG